MYCQHKKYTTDIFTNQCNEKLHASLTGYAAGPIYNGGGGGSNVLCLPQDPDWDNFKTGSKGIGYIAGVEYELFDYNNVFSTSNTGGIPLANNLHLVPFVTWITA